MVTYQEERAARIRAIDAIPGLSMEERQAMIISGDISERSSALETATRPNVTVNTQYGYWEPNTTVENKASPAPIAGSSAQPANANSDTLKKLFPGFGNYPQQKTGMTAAEAASKGLLSPIAPKQAISFPAGQQKPVSDTKNFSPQSLPNPKPSPAASQNASFGVAQSAWKSAAQKLGSTPEAQLSNIQERQKGLEELGVFQRMSDSKANQIAGQQNVAVESALSVLGLAGKDLAGKSPTEVQGIISSRVTPQNADLYNQKVLAAQKLQNLTQGDYLKAKDFSESLGTFIGKGVEQLNYDITAFNKAQEIQPKSLSKQEISDLSKSTRQETVLDIPFKVGGEIVRTSAGATSGLLDVGFGSGPAAIAISANVGKEFLGRKDKYSVEKAYETGVALRRPVTYGLGVASVFVPVIGEITAPLVAATALSDFGLKPNAENATVAIATVSGLTLAKNIIPIAGFLGAGTSTIKALGTVSKGAVLAEKVATPVFAGVSAAYLEETTAGLGQKALGGKPETILGEVEKGNYPRARELELQQGSEIGSFVVGGMAASAVISQFNIKPSFSEKDLIVREAEIQGKKGYFRMDEKFVGRETFEGEGTITARFNKFDISTKPAKIAGEKVVTGTFESPDFFTQKMLVSSTIKGPGVTIQNPVEFGQGFANIASKHELKFLASQENIKGLSSGYYESSKVIELERVGKVSSIETERMTGTVSRGQLDFKSGKTVYEKTDLTPLKDVTTTSSKSGNIVSYEEGILSSESVSGKNFLELNEKVGSFRVSRTSSIDTDAFLKKFEPKTSTGNFDYEVFPKGESKPMKPFNLAKEIPKVENTIPDIGKGGTETVTSTAPLISDVKSITAAKTGTIGALSNVQAISASASASATVLGGLSRMTPAQQVNSLPKTASFFGVSMKSVSQELAIPGFKTVSMQETKTISGTKQLSFPGIQSVSGTKSLQVDQTKALQQEIQSVKTTSIATVKAVAIQGTKMKMFSSSPAITAPLIRIPFIPPVGGATPSFDLKKPNFNFFRKANKQAVFSRKSKGKWIVQSSPFRRILGNETNVATTSKTESMYFKELMRSGALISFPTAEEFKAFTKFAAPNRKRQKKKGGFLW